MIKFISILFLNLFIFSSSWGAVQDIKSYKTSFSSTIPATKPFFDKASKLTPQTFQLGTSISYTKCEEILKRVHLKPANLDCGEESNNRFFQKLSTKNQFGQPATYLLQFTGVDGDSEFAANVQLDSSYKLIEATSATYLKSNPKIPTEFSVFSTDSDGNVFENISTKSTNGKSEMRQGISLADGTVPRGIQTTFSKPGKSNANVRTLLLLKPLDRIQIGKNPFELPSTYESIVISYENGKEKCSSAKVKATTGTVHLPSEKEWESCSSSI